MQRKERLLIPTGKERPHKESLIVDLREVESEIAPTSDPKEAVCFYCNTKGHWKRSCPKYLKDLKDRMVEKGSHSGMCMIKLYNTTTSDSWVLDIGCGTHICVVLQGLKETRRLKHGELNLVMGNRKITPVTRIGKYELENATNEKAKCFKDCSTSDSGNTSRVNAINCGGKRHMLGRSLSQGFCDSKYSHGGKLMLANRIAGEFLLMSRMIFSLLTASKDGRN
ncbi:retrotransposon protein, putative, ty1-copia subclass [Tanacetum coccineum]